MSGVCRHHIDCLSTLVKLLFSSIISILPVKNDILVEIEMWWHMWISLEMNKIEKNQVIIFEECSV